MATTAIFAEILISGLLATVWVAVLIRWFFGTAWITRLLGLKDWAGLVTILVVGSAYILGVIMDRLADWMLQRFDSRFEQAFLPIRLPGTGELRLRVMSENVAMTQFLDYIRSRLRVARSTTLNCVLIFGATLLFWLWPRAESADSHPSSGTFAFFLVLIALAGVLAYFTWRLTTRTYCWRLVEAYQIRCEEKLAKYRAAKDAPGIASSLEALGLIALQHHLAPTRLAARSFLEESHGIYLQGKDKNKIASVQLLLGYAAHLHGDSRAEQDLYARSRSIWEDPNVRRSQPDIQSLVELLANLGNVAFKHEHFSAAFGLYRDGYRASGGKGPGDAAWLERLARAAVGGGAPAEGMKLFGAAFGRKVGTPRSWVSDRLEKRRASLRRGDFWVLRPPWFVHAYQHALKEICRLHSANNAAVTLEEAIAWEAWLEGWEQAGQEIDDFLHETLKRMPM